MTNYEKLISDKKYLAEVLSDETPMYQHMNAWWCPHRCPHAKKCQEVGDDCIDEHSTVDHLMEWFEEEYVE